MKSLSVKGETYKLPSKTWVCKEFLAWNKSKEVDPLIAAKDLIKDMPPNLQEIIVRDALEERKKIQSPSNEDLKARLMTAEGLEKFLSLLLTKYQPELTSEQVWAIHDGACEEHGDAYLDGFFGGKKAP